MRPGGVECHTATVERFLCAVCRHALSVPVRVVHLPAGPHWSLLDHHHVNPPRLDPGTYAIDEGPYGRDRVAGTFVLSPGDVRGTRFVHDLASIGCWSLVGRDPCVACARCDTLVASRTDDCNVAQETRLYPATVLRETCDDGADRIPDPFAVFADWDSAPPDRRASAWTPEATRPRPGLTATRWGDQNVRAQLYRDDPPA
jgi:hypothetical protein